jgi:O-antigen ligase
MPVAHGAVEIWSVTIMHSASLFILSLWIMSLIKKGYLKFVCTPLNFPLFIFISLMTISVFFSVYPYASKIQLFKVLNYCAIFYMLMNTLMDERRFFVITRGVIILGALYGILGIVFTTGNFFSFRIFTTDNFLSFTFRNHNHFAGYMEMITWLCTGLALSYKNTKRIVFFSLATASAVAVFLSLSRGGILGFFGGLFLFTTVTAISNNCRRNLLLLLSFVVLVLFFITFIGGLEHVLERTKTLQAPTLTGEDRFLIWEGILRMITVNPWFGTGLGTFEYAYPQYQTFGGFIIKHAHNVYMELAAETGITGFLSILLCMTVLFVYVIKRLIKLQKTHLQSIGTGALSACFSILVHDFFDFNLYVPSNAMLFVVCASIAFTSTAHDEVEKSLPWLDINVTHKRRPLFYTATIFLFLALMAIIISPFLGSLYLKKLWFRWEICW